jgi:hypothetical protein
VLGEFSYPEKTESKPGLACADSLLIYPILPRVGRTIEAQGPVRCSQTNYNGLQREFLRGKNVCQK